MLNPPKTVFLSYRRTNFWTALAIYQDLTAHGFDVFFDYQSIRSGSFEQIILGNLRSRAHFIVLLTPSALERCVDPKDWLRREIETAIETKRNIVSLMIEGFDFGSEAIQKHMTGTLATLPKYNGLEVPPSFFSEAMTRLRKEYLSVAPEDVLHPASYAATDYAHEQQEEANAAPPVPKKNLTAEEWFERGFTYSEQGNLNNAIDCFTHALQLNSGYTEAYYNRGLVHAFQNDNAGAIADFTNAIRLDPNFPEAYNNRGTIHARQNNISRAIKDYTRSIELRNPNLHLPYNNRGVARDIQSDQNGAIEDYSQAIKLKPDFADAYRNRGLTRSDQGNLSEAIADYTVAIQLGFDDVVYNNRAEAYFALSQFEKALTDFQQVVSLHPNFKFALAGLAITYHALGNIVESLRIWREELLFHDEKYRDANWVGREFNWRPELIEEARKLIAKL